MTLYQSICLRNASVLALVLSGFYLIPTLSINQYSLIVFSTIALLSIAGFYKGTIKIKKYQELLQ